MSLPFQHLHREPAPHPSGQERFKNDLQFRDMLFVYPVLMDKTALNENIETYPPNPPVSVRCSFQEHALNSQHVDPTNAGSRLANIFTRYKGCVKWHDQVVCRGIKMLVVHVTDHFDNVTGQYHHTEITARFLEEPGSVSTVANPSR